MNSYILNYKYKNLPDFFSVVVEKGYESDVPDISITYPSNKYVIYYSLKKNGYYNVNEIVSYKYLGDLAMFLDEFANFVNVTYAEGIAGSHSHASQRIEAESMEKHLDFIYNSSAALYTTGWGHHVPCHSKPYRCVLCYSGEWGMSP